MLTNKASYKHGFVDYLKFCLVYFDLVFRRQVSFFTVF